MEKWVTKDSQGHLAWEVNQVQEVTFLLHFIMNYNRKREGNV